MPRGQGAGRPGASPWRTAGAGRRSSWRWPSGLTLTACGSSLAASASVRTGRPVDRRPSQADPGSTARPGPDHGRGAARTLLDTFYKVPAPLSPGAARCRSSGQRDPHGRASCPPGPTAYRVLYHSESIAGADIAVSGVIVVPGGPPPPGGFPIVSWAHGTTGLADPCAPSLGALSSISYLARCSRPG